MRKFCRITFGFAWNGLNTQFIDFAVGLRREYHTIAKFGKEGKPKRIIFVHIQYTWNTDRTAHGVLFIQWFIVSEESFVLVFKKVWNILLVFLTANTTFTTVAGNKLSAAGKTIDREKAVVGTALAARHGRFETKLVDLVDREHRAFLSGIMISGNECGTKRTHDTGDIRTYGFAAGNALKASQYRIVIESTTLNNDFFTKIFWIRQLDHF